METLLEQAAATQAALDKMKNDSAPHDLDSYRRCWDLETEMERLMRLYEDCSAKQEYQ
jgi:hypothetical protein